MKVTNHNIDKSINNIQKIDAVLLYGENSGLIDYRFKIICNRFLGLGYTLFSLIEFDFDYIKNNLDVLAAELRSLSFMADKKLIKIVNSQTTISKDFVEILNMSYKNNLVVFIAAELQANSSLRKFFDNSSKNLSIACYNFEKSNSLNFARKIFTQENYDISQSTLQLFVQRLSGDQFIVEKEMDKLKLYKQDSKIIETEDINMVVENCEDYTIDEFCNHLIIRDIKVFTIYELLVKQKIEYILIIRSLLRTFVKVFSIVLQIAQGQTANNAMKAALSGLFYRQVPFYTKAASIWKISEIIYIIDDLKNLELSYKTDNLAPHAKLYKFIITLFDPK